VYSQARPAGPWWPTTCETRDAVIIVWIALIAEIILLLYTVTVIRRAYKQSRYETYALTTLAHRFKVPARLEAFDLADSYARAGEYRKAQLHLHTSNSNDVLEKVPVSETVLRYKQAGYSFVVITDHDRVTYCPDHDSPGFVALAGEEKTLASPIWPLGKHLLRIGVDPGSADGEHLLAPAHLNWKGNFGTGRWYLPDLLVQGDFDLIEIFNGKSHSILDFWMWHKMLEERGHAKPVWGIAVDDSNNARPIDQGWVMVKTAEVSREHLLEALRAGAFYATTGPQADFKVQDGAVVVDTVGGAWIRFINSRNEVVGVTRGDHGSYRPVGDEGFIRVEIASLSGDAAWSQPFFLIPRIV
jgi:hypothetical protein